MESTTKCDYTHPSKKYESKLSSFSRAGPSTNYDGPTSTEKYM